MSCGRVLGKSWGHRAGGTELGAQSWGHGTEAMLGQSAGGVLEYAQCLGAELE